MPAKKKTSKKDVALLELLRNSLAEEEIRHVLAGALLALDEALDTLATHNRGVFDVIMFRFFAGLTLESTAEALDISTRTVKRYWTYGRTWLYRRIMGADSCRG